MNNGKHFPNTTPLLESISVSDVLFQLSSLRKVSHNYLLIITNPIISKYKMCL